MSEWFRLKDKKPVKGESCLLFIAGQGLGSDRVFGPIDWFHNDDGSHECWLDLFASPHAGTSVQPDQVDLWRPWNPIAPTDEQIESLNESTEG